MLELKLIELCDLNMYLTCQFMHKLNSGIIPNVFLTYYTINNSVYDHNTRLSKGSHELEIGNDYGTRTLQYSVFVMKQNYTFEC